MRFAEGIVGAALAAPLVAYATIGSYSRYTADDFCWAGVLRTEGFFNAQVVWYTTYSPRYAFTFLVNLAELVGPPIVPVLPTLALISFVLALTWALAGFGLRWPHAFVLGEAAAVVTLQTAPDLPQSLYWQTGMLTYLLPLILAVLLIGWIRRGHRAWWALALSCVMAFIAGGLSEAYLIPQNVALTLALLISLVIKGRASRQLAAALAGGVLALAVIVLSPSIEGRVGGPPADPWLAMSAAIATAAYQVVRLVRYFPLTILLALTLPALVGGCGWKMERRWLLVTTAAVLITLPFCYFPSFYAQNGNPPARSLIVPGSILIGYLVLLGFALRGRIERWAALRASAMIVVALVPIGIALTTWPDQATAAGYAALFDVEDQYIRATRDAGQADLTVPPLPDNLGEHFVTADRGDWFNMCVARYYGVRSIAAPAA